MQTYIVSLTKKLISIKSTSENKDALSEILEHVLSNLKDHTIERFENKGVKSALVYNSKARPKKFKIILNGHLDIIPGKEYQYNPVIKNNRLYGVGAMDMKANLACLIMLFKEIANKVNYPLGLQLVTDEEVGGFNGTKYQIDQGVRTEFAIVGETTNLTIENQAKGILWVKISCKGKAAHGAYPWMGENAIWKMNNFLNLLEKKFPIPKQKKWVTTINLSKIETGNQTFNKIPDGCTVWLDIRYIPQEANRIIESIKKTLPKGFKLDIVVKEPALFVDENNEYVQMLQKVGRKILNKNIPVSAGQGSSDARHFTRINSNAIEFGALGKGMGADNEYVDIPSLIKYSKVLEKFLLSI